MIFTLQLTRKIWTVRFVSLRVWAEMTAWKSERSALKGWSTERRPGGFRLITPLLGVGVCMMLGRRDKGGEKE